MNAPDGYEKNYKFLDSKPMFLSWEIDTFMIFAVSFGFALLFTNQFIHFAIVTGMGIIFAGLYEKVKNSSVKGFFWHIAYMLGIKQPKTLLPSYKRYFVGG